MPSIETLNQVAEFLYPGSVCDMTFKELRPEQRNIVIPLAIQIQRNIILDKMAKILSMVKM